MRWPSKGIGLTSGFMRGSCIILSIPELRLALSGQTIQPKATVSPSLSFTDIGNEVTLPSGTSSPQHSTTLKAPFSLKIEAAISACLMYCPRLAEGTAAIKPST
ncbi:hypothetical protein D9M73_246680 [compost metagenome]